MKLSNKLLIFMIITYISFIIITSLTAIRYSFPLFSLVTAVFILATSLVMYLLVIKRVKDLNKQLSEANLFNILETSHLKTHGSDEITSITNQINTILDKAKEETNTIKEETQAHLKDLQIKNAELSKEIIESKSTEKIKIHHETIAHLAHYDSTTTLPNRVFFNEILNKAINHSKRHNKILAILVINLDSFKKIDQTYGHAIADNALKEIGNRFVNTLRTEDILAKLDGDEFIVLLNDIGKPKFASSVAKKILHVCNQPIHIDSHEFTITASIGICIYPNDGDSLQNLLENSTTALYKAKQAGGNDYQFYSQEMDFEAHEFIRLESELRNAIRNNELILYFQPKLHIKRGEIVGVEALLRWPHSEYGFINPEKFIPLAEESGLIMQLGEWVLKEACKINKSWQDEGYEHITVGVNLSAKQFYHPDIVKIIADALESTKLNPGYLELEINEKTIMDNIDVATTILEKIKATGVQIAIDHFGTGYTSISHLKQLPIRTLKIDQSFIKGLPNNPNDISITTAFIGLAHNLGLEIVAEGIETAEQVQFLETQNCDILQGYFLSHPLPAQKINLQFKKLMDEVLI